MAVKLGDMLVQCGKITREQLDEGLKNQVIFGGRLGTNLIELGYVSEEELARLLGEKLGVPCVDPDQLNDLPADLVSLLPRELVEKYRVIPIALDKKRVSLAMADPSDLAAIDEISFRSGLVIRPMICPEIRLIAALEKYYQIPRAIRYIPVSSQLKEQWRSKGERTPPVPVREAKPAPPDPAEEPAELELVEEVPEEEFTIDLLSRYLVQAEDRDQIAEIILSFLAQSVDACALFVVRGSTAYGWKAVRSGKPVAGFEQLQISLSEPSVLQLVAQGRSFYIGPVSATPANGKIFQGVRAQRPLPVCLVPLLMMGRVVNILYIDDNGGEVGDRLAGLQAIVAKAAMAFEILILKSKILQ